MKHALRTDFPTLSGQLDDEPVLIDLQGDQWDRNSDGTYSAVDGAGFGEHWPREDIARVFGLVVASTEPDPQWPTEDPDQPAWPDTDPDDGRGPFDAYLPADLPAEESA